MRRLAGEQTQFLICGHTQCNAKRSLFGARGCFRCLAATEGAEKLISE